MPEPSDGVVDAELDSLRAKCLVLRAIPHDHEDDVVEPAKDRQRFQCRAEVLHRIEPRHGYDRDGASRER